MHLIAFIDRLQEFEVPEGGLKNLKESLATKQITEKLDSLDATKLADSLSGNHWHCLFILNWHITNAPGLSFDE